MRSTCFLPLLFLTACGNAEKKPSENKFVPPVIAPGSLPEIGCYLGHHSNAADTVQLRLEAVAPDHIQGRLRIAIAEKDSRNGEISGTQGSDGIIRVVYRFMQEGVADSVRMQFRYFGDKSQPIELRASAYDPQTGREYPDTTKDFSSGAIRLRPVPCPGN